MFNTTTLAARQVGERKRPDDDPVHLFEARSVDGIERSRYGTSSCGGSEWRFDSVRRAPIANPIRYHIVIPCPLAKRSPVIDPSCPSTSKRMDNGFHIGDLRRIRFQILAKILDLACCPFIMVKTNSPYSRWSRTKIPKLLWNPGDIIGIGEGPTPQPIADYEYPQFSEQSDGGLVKRMRRPHPSICAHSVP